MRLLYRFVLLPLFTRNCCSFSAGSNEALPSRLPSNVRGLRGDNPPDSTTIEHKLGISRKRAKPKLAWAEEQVIPPEASLGS